MLRLSLLLATVGAAPALADLKLDIEPVYFQSIQPRAFVDGRGTVWFTEKHHVHDIIGKRVASGPDEKHYLFHVDAAGRFWFWDYYQRGTKPVVYTDGKTTTQTKLVVVAIHDDTAGRVFLRTAKSVHVLTPKGEWSEQDVFEKDNWGQSAFTEDPKGRTWFWVVRNRPNVQAGNEGTPGAWCFDGKSWKRYGKADGLPFEDVKYVLPFADDWFLVQEQRDEFARSPEWALWSPSRTAKEIAAAKAFKGVPTYSLHYDGTDLDGNRYLHRSHSAHDGATQYEPGTYRVSPKGETKRLTEDEERAIRRQTRVIRDPMQPIFAKPGDPQHIYQDTSNYDCLGMDKEGRIWFKQHYGDLGSHCLWPAKEKVGDILRLEPFGKRNNHGGYLLTGGEAWSYYPNALERWDSKKWAADDPFPAFKASQWMSRAGPPPGYHVANFRHLDASATGDGGLLAARVTTRFEGTVFERFGRGPGVPEEEPKKVDPKAPLYVYQLALRADHRWGKPDEPLKVLKANAKNLIKSMKADRADPRAVAVCSDGTRLWAAFDWKLHVIEASGDVTTVELQPPDKPKPGAAVIREEPEMSPLMMASLLPLAENKVLVLTPAGARVATFRTTKVREIGLTTVAGATTSTQPTASAGGWGGPREVTVPFTLQRDKAGAVWGWVGTEALYKFDGEKFTALKQATAPLAITDDGVLWCRPWPLDAKLPPGAKRPVSMVRVCGDSVEKFTWKPEEIETGFTKPSKGSALVWPSEYGLLCVEAQVKAGERPTLRTRTYSESMGWSGVGPGFVVTGTGEILFAGHWGRLFE